MEELLTRSNAACRPLYTVLPLLGTVTVVDEDLLKSIDWLTTQTERRMRLIVQSLDSSSWFFNLTSLTGVLSIFAHAHRYNDCWWIG